MLHEIHFLISHSLPNSTLLTHSGSAISPRPIPIKSAYKNHVGGSIIETSSTGSTVVIEPKAISKLAGEMQMLEAEEMAEQYQILAGLTGIIYENISSIKQNMELMATYDLIFAKARYSISINAAMLFG